MVTIAIGSRRREADTPDPIRIGKERLGYVEDMFSEEKLKGYGYFDANKVTRLKAKCQKGGGQLLSERENMAVVGILSTQLLHHHFI